MRSKAFISMCQACAREPRRYIGRQMRASSGLEITSILNGIMRLENGSIKCRGEGLFIAAGVKSVGPFCVILVLVLV